MSTKQDGNTFTARDFELLAGAIGGCTKAPVEVDYKKMAEKFGFKNSNSAKACWNSLKKKLDKMAGGSVAPSLSITPAEEAEKKSKGGKKRKGSSDEDGDENDEAETADPKPKKKGRKTPLSGSGKGKAVAAPASDDQDDEEQPMMGVKYESAD